MNLQSRPSLHTFALPSTRQEESCFALLAFSGGIAGAFGSVYCGHVFANAETGNLISMFTELHAGEWIGVLCRLGGLGLYILGIALTVILPVRLCKNDTRRWQRICLMVETVCFLVQAFLPFEQLSQISYALYLWPVFFALALQYNSFTALHGVPVSTVFCTNNFRQMTIHALIWRRLRHTHAPDAYREAGRELRISLTYVTVTVLFFAGVAFSVFTLDLLGPRQMLLCAAFMLALWLWMTFSRREENSGN